MESVQFTQEQINSMVKENPKMVKKLLKENKPKKEFKVKLVAEAAGNEKRIASGKYKVAETEEEKAELQAFLDKKDQKEVKTLKAAAIVDNETPGGPGDFDANLSNVNIRIKEQ